MLLRDTQKDGITICPQRWRSVVGGSCRDNGRCSGRGSGRGSGMYCRVVVGELVEIVYDGIDGIVI